MVAQQCECNQCNWIVHLKWLQGQILSYISCDKKKSKQARKEIIHIPTYLTGLDYPKDV